MRGTLMTFVMLASLVALWWVVHWVARLIVTEYGILGGLVACGVIYVTSLIMDHYDLWAAWRLLWQAKKFQRLAKNDPDTDDGHGDSIENTTLEVTTLRTNL
jgi:hypothetical protein